MITEDKVIDFFCIADDFCKFFDAQMAKYSFKAERKRIICTLYFSIEPQLFLRNIYYLCIRFALSVQTR